jgi:hypothetical protein
MNPSEGDRADWLWRSDREVADQPGRVDQLAAEQQSEAVGQGVFAKGRPSA